MTTPEERFWAARDLHEEMRGHPAWSICAPVDDRAVIEVVLLRHDEALERELLARFGDEVAVRVEPNAGWYAYAPDPQARCDGPGP